jgi:RsiW-degrading membrane proteinase PrsW (M82 family)
VNQATEAESSEARRLARVATNSAGLWWALALEIAGLLLFVLIFNFLFPSLGDNLGDGGRVALGLAFALVPALLWLSFFYSFDRLEPEPKRMVIATFAGGAILFAALVQPLLNRVFGIDAWLSTTWWSRLLGGVLVVGVIEQYMVYLAVRYLVFEHAEFDERVDGVIYAVAAGLGVATVINFDYVLARGGVDLDIGSVRMVVNALAYASFAGVLGYFIGQARFERVPWYYLPGGLLAAATLNGLLFFVLERPSTGLGAGKPWGALALAAAVALGALLIVFWLVARANEETLRLLHSTPAQTPAAAPAPHVRRSAVERAERSSWFGGEGFAGAPVAASLGHSRGDPADDAFTVDDDARPQQEPPPPRPPEKGDPTGGAA